MFSNVLPQNTIKELENELINRKFDMSGYLLEYQDLLTMKLGVEILSNRYRHLFGGKDDLQFQFYIILLNTHSFLHILWM